MAGGVFSGCSAGPDEEVFAAFSCLGAASSFTAGRAAFFSGLASSFFSLLAWGGSGSWAEADFSSGFRVK